MSVRSSAVLLFSALVVAACSRDAPKPLPDAANDPPAVQTASQRILGTWALADASDMLSRFEGAERERVAKNLAGMTWEFAPGRMITYQDHKQTHDDAITVVDDATDRTTLRNAKGDTQEMVFLADGTLEMRTPKFGKVVLKRPR